MYAPEEETGGSIAPALVSDDVVGTAEEEPSSSEMDVDKPSAQPLAAKDAETAVLGLMSRKKAIETEEKTLSERLAQLRMQSESMKEQEKKSLLGGIYER